LGIKLIDIAVTVERHSEPRGVFGARHAVGRFYRHIVAPDRRVADVEGEDAAWLGVQVRRGADPLTIRDGSTR
jgi:hypothetical protein